MSETIGFIGLGQLGLPMATNLVTAGYSVRVHNRTAGKAAGLLARGAQLAARPADAATAGGIVVSVLWDDASVEAVVTSDGFLERLGPGGIHISMSTISPAASRRLAALHARSGSAYVAAPIFGRPEAAVARKLWVPIAGAASAKERARPVVAALGAQEIFDFGGDEGAATVVKLVGNFLIVSAVRSLAEALSVADKSGVDVKAAVDMLTQTLFPAPIYQSYGKMIAEGTATSFSQSAIPLKDMSLLDSTAREVQSPTPILSHFLESLRSA